jgi:hypothetical protein
VLARFETYELSPCAVHGATWLGIICGFAFVPTSFLRPVPSNHHQGRGGIPGHRVGDWDHTGEEILDIVHNQPNNGIEVQFLRLAPSFFFFFPFSPREWQPVYTSTSREPAEVVGQDTE